ncbi:MAG: rhomboid family intrarane serine protease [Ramlibacter sp.]|nr:rhomboid family intrarane serine protease [Ramlibacter sp.]
MEETGQADAAALQFLASSKSRAAKSRRWLWVIFVAALASAFVRSGGGGAFVFTASLLLLFAAIDRFVLRPTTRPGRVLITLGPDAIESERFNTKAKRFAWADVLDVGVEQGSGGRMLQLRLRPIGRRRGLREFLNGIDPALPRFPLNLLEPLEQERLVDAIGARLRQWAGVGDAVALAAHNVLTEEREFAERLRALAPRTWVTWALVATNVAAWAGTVLLGADVVRPDAARLLAFGGNSASEVQQGEWWRLLTSAFLHSGVIHLVMNMIGLLAIGPTTERIYGHRLFLLVYLGCALAGSASSMHFSAQTVVSVGASGAVFGVAGALLVAVFHHRKNLPRLFGKQTLSGLGIFVAYSLFQGLATTGIDNAAHIGGLLAGAALATVLPERFDIGHFHRTVRTRALLAALGIGVATLVIAGTAPRPPYDLSELYVAAGAGERGLKEFARAFAALRQEVQDVKAGKLTELEADERSRTVHAPRFRLVLQDLSQAKLPASDPRAALVAQYTQFTRLMVESLQMESHVVDGKPVPADPARAAAIEAEITQIAARIPTLVSQLKAAQPPGRRRP